MVKKAQSDEIPPNSENRSMNEIRIDDANAGGKDVKLDRMRKSLAIDLSPTQLAISSGGRKSRSGRSLRQAESSPGSIPGNVAKFVTKTNTIKSPKQKKSSIVKSTEKKLTEPVDNNNVADAITTEATAANNTNNLDNKENHIEIKVPEPAPAADDEVEIVPIKLEPEDSCIVQTKLTVDDHESFSKSPSEDPHSDGEKFGSRDFSDTDSALGSTASFKDKTTPTPAPKADDSDWQIGSVVWGSFNRFNWFPCMVYPYGDGTCTDLVNKQTVIQVKYFNYNGMVADLPPKNLLEFGTLDEFNEQMKKLGVKKSKMKPFSKTVYRAMEEARIFQGFPIESRKDLLDEIVDLSRPKAKKSIGKIEDRVKAERKSVDSAMDVASPAPSSPNNTSEKSDAIQHYLECMQRYDEINSVVVKKEKVVKVKVEPVEVKVEPEDDKDRRKSGRVVKKRKYEDFIRQDTIPSTTTVVKPEPTEESKAKRPKIVKTLTLEERFGVSEATLKEVLKNSNKRKRICIACVQETSEQTYRCSGNGHLKCSGWLHAACAGSFSQVREEVRHVTGDCDDEDEDDAIIQVNIKTTLVCKDCIVSCKNCFVCTQQIVTATTTASTSKKSDFYQCPNQECRLAFHASCLTQWPQTNGFSSKKTVFCPQHTCHSCFYAGEHKVGALIKCIKCPASYHTRLSCIPAGTKIFSQTQCLCPRHPDARELKALKELKPLNIDWCHMCMTSGSLVCCDFCPSAFHPECIGYVESAEKFMCRECQEGRLPLYNSIVWTRVGAYRWWPGLILTESQAFGTARYEREFCLKFFGSNDHHWTTSERCYNYEGSTFLQKKGNSRLDNVFNIALDEAEQWSERLKQQQCDASSSKPKPYAKILTNRCVAPVKLKKGDDSLHACGCSKDDEDPCGKNSDCTNMHLNYECSPTLCPAEEKCRNQKLQKRENAEIKIVKTPSRGFGAIAINDLEENTFVIEYVGELIDTNEHNRRIDVKMRNKEKDFYILAVDRDLYVDAEPAGNLARFINHSCDPNCVTRKITVDGNTRIGIYTAKTIKAGTELTFDYKMEFVGGRKCACFCGSAKCSGSIGEKPIEEKKQSSTSGVALKKTKKRIRRSQSARDSTSSAASSFASSTPAPKRQKIAKPTETIVECKVEPTLTEPSVEVNSPPPPQEDQQDQQPSL